MLKKILFVFFCFLFTLANGQTQIYVSTNGNDNTGNGSINSPYATVAKAAAIADAQSNAVTIWVRSGTYRNADFTTNNVISENSYDPQNAGEAIWKQNSQDAVRLNNINGANNAWITIKPYNNEEVIFEGDGDITFNIRNCSYIRIEGFKIKGVLDKLPRSLAWKYWGTYRYLSGGSYVYADRKTDICTRYGISPCTDIPPNVFTSSVSPYPDFTGLPNINSLNVQRPNIFQGKGLLVNLSHHIEIYNCEVYNFPGGGLRVTASDYVDIIGNSIHHNSSRSSVGTHGLVVEGLEAQSGVNTTVQKMLIARNRIYSNYNEIYSWVQSKTICTTMIDEGKGLALLRTNATLSNFNGIIRVENNLAWDNGKSGIHTNEVDKAEIVNNTVFNNAHTNIYDAGISGGTNAGISIQSSNDIKIINNIAVVPNALSPAVQALSEGLNCTGEIVKNNLVFGGAINDFAGGFTIADPKFVDLNANNVNLQSNSPAINAGSAIAGEFAATDFAGNTRNSTPDIGAYEYQTPLSVSFLDFKGVFQGSYTEGGSFLTWTIASEYRNAYFEIEHSTDAKVWSKIGSVKGRENGNILQNYAFMHKNPPASLNYYRLKSVSITGDTDLSSVIILEKKQNILRVYPNPTKDIFTIELSDIYSEVYDIQLFNSVGQPVSFKKTVINNQQIMLEKIDNLLGLHYLFVRVGNCIISQKVIFE